MNSDPFIAGTSRRSTPKTDGSDCLDFVISIATWVQLPGAEPKSITFYPGFMMLNLCYISISLKAALER